MADAIVTRLICPVCNAEQGTSLCPVCKGAGDLGMKIEIPKEYKEWFPGVFVWFRGPEHEPAASEEKHPRAGTACGAYATDCGYSAFECPYTLNDKGECPKHGKRIG